MNIHLLTPREKYMFDVMENEVLNPTARFLLFNMMMYDEPKDYDEYYVLKNYPKFTRTAIMDGYQQLVNLGYLKRVTEKHITHFYLDLGGKMDLSLFN